MAIANFRESSAGRTYQRRHRKSRKCGDEHCAFGNLVKREPKQKVLRETIHGGWTRDLRVIAVAGACTTLKAHRSSIHLAIFTKIQYTEAARFSSEGQRRGNDERGKILKLQCNWRIYWLRNSSFLNWRMY